MNINKEFHDDPEFQELLQQYFAYLQESLSTLKKSMENKDYLSLQKFGHNLKGSGGGYGYNSLSELGRNMEQAAKEQNDQKYSKFIKQLEDFLATHNI